MLHGTHIMQNINKLHYAKSLCLLLAQAVCSNMVLMCFVHAWVAHVWLHVESVSQCVSFCVFKFSHCTLV